MKVLSLEEIKAIETRENYPDMNIVLSDEMTKLVHTAREYHRLTQALEALADPISWKMGHHDALARLLANSALAASTLKESKTV